jgi:hypothetical protein
VILGCLANVGVTPKIFCLKSTSTRTGPCAHACSPCASRRQAPCSGLQLHIRKGCHKTTIHRRHRNVLLTAPALKELLPLLNTPALLLPFDQGCLWSGNFTISSMTIKAWSLNITRITEEKTPGPGLYAPVSYFLLHYLSLPSSITHYSL